MKNAIKIVLLFLIARPFVWFFLGLNRYSRIRVPRQGAFILTPNHNSHLDTLLLLGLLPIQVAARTSFVAAGDYFYDIPLFSCFLFGFLEFVPVWRKTETMSAERAAKFGDPITTMGRVLEEGRVLALFPEGTRGAPEVRVGLKRGVGRLAVRHPKIPVYPLYLRGLGKSLPKGDMVFVPLIPQVLLGDPIYGEGKSEEEVMDALAKAFETLEQKVDKKDWVAT